MSESLVDELARIAREQRRPVDPRWEALTRGELSEAEQAALLAEDEAGELGPIFAPLGADATEAMTAKVLATLSSEAAPGEVIPLHAHRGASAAPGVVPQTSRTPRRWARWVVPLVAMAAGVLWTVGLGDRGEALPAYGIERLGGDRALRAGEATPEAIMRLSPGGRVVLVARPAVEVEGTVVAAVEVRPAAGPPLPWGGTMEVSEAGAVRLSGTVGVDLQLPVGEGTITIVVRRDDDAAGRGARTLTVPILVVE